MIIKNTIKSSYKFVGFGKASKCQNCNNQIIESFYILNMKHSTTLLPDTNQLGDVFAICPICEHQSKFGKVTGLFGSKAKREELSVALDLGKEHTKNAFDKFNPHQKTEYLKLLNKLGQEKLVLYLNF